MAESSEQQKMGEPSLLCHFGGPDESAHSVFRSSPPSAKVLAACEPSPWESASTHGPKSVIPCWQRSLAMARTCRIPSLVCCNSHANECRPLHSGRGGLSGTHTQKRGASQFWKASTRGRGGGTYLGLGRVKELKAPIFSPKGHLDECWARCQRWVEWVETGHLP